MQTMLAQESTEAEAAWGKVKVRINGNQEILDIQIDPELLTVDNKEKLQNAIKDATNDAIKKVQRIMADKVRQSGINLPGLS